jgi:hypothetical protein
LRAIVRRRVVHALQFAQCMRPSAIAVVLVLTTACIGGLDGTEGGTGGGVTADTACVGCHGRASPGGAGIEDAHPWAPIGCTGCHGGDGAAASGTGLSKEESHVHIPHEIAREGSVTTPDEPAYRNVYLGRAGVEELEGGLDWIQFMNPGDLRVVDRTCARAGCHTGMGDTLRRSTMSTLVGKYDAMLYATGVRREPHAASVIDDDSSYGKRLATYGALDVDDPSWDPATAPPGSVSHLHALRTIDRESDLPFGTFTEEDVLVETINKLCGNCHLNNNGANDKYGTFRSAGCSACHMRYDYSGRSQSADPMIPKDEPTYPEAYTAIRYPERPHPIRHQLVRNMTSEDCLPCHTGSNRTVWQYMGIRTDDNRDLTRAREAGIQIDFEYAQLIDNDLEPEARLHGFTQDQLIEYEDLDEDGQDDTPPDVHYLAGLECIDCHTANEMHGDGRIYSRQNQATEIRCVSCHGNIDYPAQAEDNPVNRPHQHLFVFDRVPAFGEPGYPNVTQAGVWLHTKSKGEWKYVPQIRWTAQWDPGEGDCFADGRRQDPRTSGFVCNPLSSIAHGRWQGLNQAGGDLDDGTGPRPGVEVERGPDGTSTSVSFGFSHLGDEAGPNEDPDGGLMCSACHGTWHNMRYGNHVGLVDTDGTQRFYDWDRVTGEMTIGKQGWFDFTYVDMLDLQLGVTARGKVGWFIPTRLKLFVRGSVLDPGANAATEFMNIVGDADHDWKTYRDRNGFGNALYEAVAGVDRAPGWSPPCLDSGYCDADPRKNVNGALGVDQMEPHSTQRRARDCTSCHLDENGGGSSRIGAVYGWSPQGYTPANSAYLSKIRQIVTGHGTYSTDEGFVISDDGIRHKLDWMVDQETGYPYVYTLHGRTDGGRGVPTYDPDAAGPITKALIDELTRIRVRDAR